ncbi:hypothetical protein chiPu_0013515, partial [Chiloscyllium punctatum]|nr:hypothetical protein [Chiloscyllium punctatum]
SKSVTSHSEESAAPFVSSSGSEKTSSVPISVLPIEGTSPNQSHLTSPPTEGSSLMQSTSYKTTRQDASVPQNSTVPTPNGETTFLNFTHTQSDITASKLLISASTLKKKRQTTLYPSVGNTTTRIIPVSSPNSTLPITSHLNPTNSTMATTMDYCRKCTCLNGGTCNSSATTEDYCLCHCPPSIYGNLCQNGNNISNVVLSPDSPQREINLILWINRTWDVKLENTSSVEYRHLTDNLVTLLSPLFRKASPKHFDKVIINEFRAGSIVTNSSGLYNYSASQAEINYLNNDLATRVQNIVNNTDLLENLTASVRTTVTVTRVYAPPPLITNVTELNMTCDIKFASYKLNCGSGNHCICEGPCKRNPGVCNNNGHCLNQVDGSTCLCYQHTFYQYTGKHCQTFTRNSRFYGVLFGVLAAGLLILLVIIITIIFCCQRKRSRSSDRRHSLKWYSIDEEYFRFPQTDLTAVTPTQNDGKPLGKRRGKYSLDEHQMFEDELGSGVWRPNLDEVDTEAEIRAKRPEMVIPSSGEH